VVVFEDITALLEQGRMREEFLASAAHDLKTPLAGIRGLAQLAQRRLAPLTDPGNTAIADMLANMDIAVGQMARLIDELLDMSRLRANVDLDLDRKPTDLVALVRAAVSRAQSQAAFPIQLEIAAEELWAGADSNRLDRVLANLLGNAMKYGGDTQPITVRVGREEEAAGPVATISVSDRGVGIPTADLPRIFERFYRGANVVGQIQGTGIGLAVVRKIVEQHRGTVSVESREGVGSTFIMRLPLAGP
jgi:two-component system phosphate regulon sensor histidine kinase PhoR